MTLLDYELGTESAATLAQKIVELLFERDFDGDEEKWDIASAVASVVEENVCYDVSKEATWNHRDDIYSVATAKARIRLQGDNEIRVEGYSYYVAG